MKNSAKSKWRYLWILPIILLTMSSIPKIFSMDFMVENMESSGMEVSLFLLGSIELLCVILFLIPKTRKIGFLFTTAFIGGIIAMEWMTPPYSPVTGIILQVLLWTGIYFEYPEFFRFSPKHMEASA